MRKYAEEDRLFRHLNVVGQRRQIIFTKGTDDDFFVNLTLGAMPLEQAIVTHLLDDTQERKHDIVLLLDRRGGSTILKFPTQEMEQAFAKLNTPRCSSDPRGGKRLRHTEEEDEEQQSEQPATNTTPAQNTSTTDVIQQLGGDEEPLLGNITRVLREENTRKTRLRFAIIYVYPDTMLLSSNHVQDNIGKLRCLSEWAHLENCTSYLILDEHRQEEFNRLLDWVWNNDDYSKCIELPHPDKRELAAFLKRAVCRNRLFCCDVEAIAATAAAEGTTLRNFAVRLKDFVNDHPENALLDRFYNDDEKVHSRDVVCQQIDALVGLNEVKEYVRDLCKLVADNEQLGRAGYQRNRMQPLPHFLFLGNPGTGKTSVARLLGSLFLSLGLRTRNAFVEISLADLTVGNTSPVERMTEKIHEAMGGILFVDEVYLLAEDRGGSQALQVLMKEMEDKRDAFTVIMTTYAEKLPLLYKVNPGFTSRIGRIIHFPDYSVEELIEIIHSIFKAQNVSLDAKAEARVFMNVENRLSRGGIGNGRGARTLAEKILAAMLKRDPKSKIALEEDVPEPMSFHREASEKLIQEVEQNITGLPRVKEFMRKLFRKQLAAERRRNSEGPLTTAQQNRSPEPNNCFFLGNPGTGKTTLARKMGELFYDLGLVSEKNKLKEVDPMQEFASIYTGEFAQKVRNAFDDALGGVLFIDEAYQLANDDQGKKILDQIVKLTTEPRYLDMVVVMAGYPDEMLKLFQCNPGLKRRFPNQVYFDDFTIDQLVEIFLRQVNAENLRMGGDKRSFDAHLRAILANMAAERHFGNAGAVINFFRDTVLGNQAARLLATPGAPADELLTEDLLEGSAIAEPLSKILADFDREFVGLANVREHISTLANNIRVNQLRAQRLGIPPIPGTQHLCFVGNGGTGKKSVAAYMARIFCSLGLISHPRLKIWRGVDLKGSYLGQTKDKVNQMFEESADSLLLIDSPDVLDNENTGPQDTYAAEALEAIAGGMADPRNATVIVLLTGTEERLSRFLNRHPQLSVYFPQRISFPDYSDDECLELLKRRLTKAQYKIPPAQEDTFNRRIKGLLEELRKAPDLHCTNAFAAQTIFAKMMDRRGKRLGAFLDQGKNPTDEMLQNIEVTEDVPNTMREEK